MKEITISNLNFINKWKNKYKPNMKIIFRPHPASILSDYKKFSFFELSQLTFKDDIERSDIFCVNNTTSAAADIYNLGLPVITYNDLDRINFSPILDKNKNNTTSNIDEFDKL